MEWDSDMSLEDKLKWFWEYYDANEPEAQIISALQAQLKERENPEANLIVLCSECHARFHNKGD